MALRDELTGRRAVVFGGTGFVGRHLVRRWLSDGVEVVVPSRSAASLAALSSMCGPLSSGLVPLVCDISDPAETASISSALGDRGGVDYAVASLGGWWEGERLVRLSPDVWHDLLRSHLTAHFLAAQAAVVHLRDTTAAGLATGPAYVTLNGIAALQPETGSGPVSVTGAAQAMLLDVLRAENDRPGTRFSEVCVVNPIVPNGEAEDASEAVVEIDDVVEEIVNVAARGSSELHRRTIGEA